MEPVRPAPLHVLVHSPLLGPSAWAPVARELERRGRATLVPSLPGMAHASEPYWRQCTEAVRAAARDVSEAILLVGHSGAGALLPPIAAALEGEIRGLLFVDAFLPPPAGAAQPVPPDLALRLRSLADRDGVLPPWWAWWGEDAFAESVPEEAMRVALRREMPRLPLAYFESEVPVPDRWSEHPCAYLLLAPDSYGLAAVEARSRGWPVAELEGSHHLSLVTDPVTVAGALLGLEGRML